MYKNVIKLTDPPAVRVVNEVTTAPQQQQQQQQQHQRARIGHHAVKSSGTENIYDLQHQQQQQQQSAYFKGTSSNNRTSAASAAVVQHQQTHHQQQLDQQQQHKQHHPHHHHHKQQQAALPVFHSYPTAQQLVAHLPRAPPRGPLPPQQLQKQQQQLGRQPHAPSFYSMFSQIAQITDNLYLCGCHALKASKLRQLGITHVINATKEIGDMPDVHTIRVLVNDVPTAQLSGYFDKVADKVDKVRKEGGRVLIHCVAGVSRSSSLCIVYLMKYHRMTLREAYNHVKSRRPVIHPNVGFFKQMLDYEKKLFGKNTVKFINSSVGPIPDVYKEQVKAMVLLR